MELIIKGAMLALTTAVLGLLLRRTNPEYTLLLGMCASLLILLAAMRFLDGLHTLAETVNRMAGSSDTLLSPILKCLAIAIVTRFASGLCTDASQSSTAAALEFAGSVCAMSVAMPLILSMLKMIGALL